MRIFTSAAGTLAVSLVSSMSFGQVYSLDPTFGTAGKASVTFPTAASTDLARTLALQPNGSIVVAGRNNNLFGLARLTSQGQPDATFGTAGTVTTAFAPPLGASSNITIDYAQPETLLLQADGKLVAAGRLRSTGPTYRGYARYLPSGALDTSFDSDGKLVPYNSEGSLGSYAAVLKQQPDGQFLSIGWQMGLTGSVMSPIYRLTNAGAADNSYAWTYPSAGPNASSNTYDKTVADATVDAAGKLVTAGVHYVMNQNYTGPQGPALVRYTTTGQPDPTFGTDGLATLTAANGGSGLEWKKLVLQADGKILVASLKLRSVGNQDVRDSVGVARYQANGMLDTSFGRRGVAIASFNEVAKTTNAQALCGLQVLPSGDMLVGVQTDAGTFNLVQFSATGKYASVPTIIPLPGFEAADMALQPDGKVLVAGTQTYVINPKQFVVIRLASSTQLSTRSRLSAAQVELYPNPASQKVVLHLTGVAEGQPLKLQVSDMLGRQVLSLPAARLVAGQVEVPLQSLRPGSYTLQVQGSDFTLTRQLVRAE